MTPRYESEGEFIEGCINCQKAVDLCECNPKCWYCEKEFDSQGDERDWCLECVPKMTYEESLK